MPTQAVEEVIRKLIGSGHNDIAHELIQLKSLLSLDDKGTTIAASSFTLEKVINDFNLSYSPHVGLVGSNPHRWKIIDKDDDLDFPMSSYFCKSFICICYRCQLTSNSFINIQLLQKF
jgi:hypothetical protein